MMTKLRKVSSHLVKKTEIAIHFLSNTEGIRELFQRSDFWEFREKTFNYPANQVSKIKFKQKIENILESKPSNVKKSKI